MTREEAAAALREGREDVPPEVLRKYQWMRDRYILLGMSEDAAEKKAQEMMIGGDWPAKPPRTKKPD